MKKKKKDQKIKTNKQMKIKIGVFSNFNKQLLVNYKNKQNF